MLPLTGHGQAVGAEGSRGDAAVDGAGKRRGTGKAWAHAFGGVMLHGLGRGMAVSMEHSWIDADMKKSARTASKHRLLDLMVQSSIVSGVCPMVLIMLLRFTVHLTFLVCQCAYRCHFVNRSLDLLES